MAEIIKLRPADDADEVLEAAKGEYDQVVTVGWNKRGEMEVRATLGIPPAEIIYLMELFKHAILSEGLD